MICDVCEAPAPPDDVFLGIALGAWPDGWRTTARGRVLCPRCHRSHRARLGVGVVIGAVAVWAVFAVCAALWL